MSEVNTRTTLSMPPSGDGDLEEIEPMTGETLLPCELAQEEAAEKTIQAASFLVEKITPVPPPRSEVRNLAAAAVADVPTANVQNPGSRMPASLRETPPFAPLASAAPQIPAPEPLVFQQATAARESQRSSSATPQNSAEAPPDVDTAYVPIPVGQGSGQAKAAQAKAAERLPVPTIAPTQALPAQDQVALANALTKSPLRQRLDVLTIKGKQALERFRGNKNARLAVLASGGVLGLLLVWMVFSPARQVVPQEAPVMNVGAAAPQPAPQKPEAPLDPAAVQQRDVLLERAVLAVEAGRLDEALAIFRKYSEEHGDPTAEFMVQLLLAQIAQGGREEQQ